MFIKKKILFILVICILLTGCGVSKSELKENKKQYNNSIKALCEEYNLKDCKIEIDDFSKIDNIYIADTYIYSDNFSKLSSNDAFFFAKELSELEDEIETKSSDVIAYSEYIISNDSKYYYDNEKGIDYLMKDTESVYTIKNGQVMYDIFEKGY